jgi:hypothetical protein
MDSCEIMFFLRNCRGKEKWFPIKKSAYPNISASAALYPGFLFAFNLSNEHSFMNLMEMYLKSDLFVQPVIVVGIDFGKKRSVCIEDIADVVIQNDLHYYEISDLSSSDFFFLLKFSSHIYLKHLDLYRSSKNKFLI